MGEFELIEFLNILWKRKWLIIIPTFLCVIISGIYSFLLPPIWEVDTIILPSKFLFQTEQGQIEEIVVTDPKQIAGQINEASYNNIIANELKLDIKKFPKLRAENLRETKLVRISTRANDVENAKLILSSLFTLLKKDLDKKIDVEIKGLDTQIETKKNEINSKEMEIKDKGNETKLKKILIEDKKNEIKTKQNRIKNKENLIKIKDLDIESKEIDKKKIEEEINTLKNKFKISEERVEAITKEMKEVKNRIDKIEEEQRNVLKRENNTNALSMLLYSNEVQNNLRYYNTLNENLSNEKITQENINLSIEDKKGTIKQTDNQIEQIKTQIDDIKTEIDDIHTQIDNINNEIGKINNEIDTIKNGIVIKENEIANFKNDITFLQERKARIDYAQMIKEPTPSLGPVAPRKKVNVLIAGIFGLFIFTILAFFVDYIEKQKAKL